MPSKLLASLDDRQRVVAEASRGPVAVLAVAGAGKTRAIAHRIAYAVATGAQDPERGLALTYTSKAAFELRSRLAALGVVGVSVGTIHALALRQLNYFWPKLVGGPIPTLLTNRELELSRILEVLAPELTSSDSRRLRGTMEWAKASGLDLPGLLAAGRLPEEQSGLATSLWQQYEEQNLRSGRIDFDDLLQLLTGMLELRPDAAAEVRRRYSWVNVDEYQDITPLQESLLRQWLGESREICVVGDVNQAIYGFAGADASLLASFAKRYPDAAVLELDRTYRCKGAIAQLASTFLPKGSLSPRPAVAGGEVSLDRFEDVASEVAAVVERVGGLLASGVDPREVAILVRVGAQIERFERAFAAVGLPFTSRGAISPDHPVVRRAMLSLRATGSNPAGAFLVDAVRAAVLAAGWVESDTDSDQWAAGSGLIALADDLVAAEPATDLRGYTAELERRLTALSPPRPVAVTLATMHSAKGLEWQHVFLPGLSDRLLPYPGVDEESERNLLYVAVTRAGSALYLSWSETDERGRAVGLTPFLRGDSVGGKAVAAMPLLPALSEAQAVAAALPKSGGSDCSQCGGALDTYRERMLRLCSGCTDVAEPALISHRVDSWRANLASVERVPEQQLLPDQSVERILSAPPVDLAAFRQIPARHDLISDFAAELLLKLLRD